MAEIVNGYTETDLGNVAPNPRGDYSETGEYEYLDLVAYAGGSYICIKEDGTISGTAPTPGKTTEIWQEVSRPGNLTPEYVAMHDDVVNKAASVAEDAASVAADRVQVEGMKENVAALQEQTAQDALLTKEYRESAAGYASAADSSRTAAGESEENIRALVNGFDGHVEQKKQSAQDDITTSRQDAIKAIAAQQVSSVNTVKQEGQKAIDKTNVDAEATAADRAAVSEMSATIDGQATQVAQNAAQVAEDKATAENYMQTAGESKKQALEAAERLKDSVNLVQKNTVDLQGKAPAIIGSATSYGTPVEVNDSAEMQLQGLRLYGKSKQFTTTGKNLSSIKNCQLSTNMVSSDIVPWTKKDRIYFSCDTENVDGSKIYVICRYYNESKIRVGANGTILLADGIRKEISFRGVGASSYGGNVDLTTIEYVNIEIGLSSASTAASSIDNIMVCEEENQPYEPYTGGKPSPSPEYPQEIVSVGQKLGTGKNLVKIPDKEVGWAENIENITQITTLKNGYYVLSVKIELEQTLSEFNNTDICRISFFGGDGELIAQASKKWGDYAKRFLSIIITPAISLNKIESATLYGCGNDTNGKTGMARFYDFQIEKGTEVTEYEPYTEGVPTLYQKDVEMGVTSKNYVNTNKLEEMYKHENGSYYGQANLQLLTMSKVFLYDEFKSGKSYKFSVTLRSDEENVNPRLAIIYTDGTKNVTTGGPIATWCYQEVISDANKIVSKCYINYSGDGNIYIKDDISIVEYPAQSLSITTPTGLPAIPVPSGTSGITYTDTDGQAWIADEIDFARGKYIQRVWKGVFDGSSDEEWSVNANYFFCKKLPSNMSSREGFSNQYAGSKIRIGNRNEAIIIFDADYFENNLSNWKVHLASNPLVVMTYLGTPIETDLSQEQLQAYKSLTTFKPTSIISNDAGAQMEVEYACDTKTYIDNKLREIAQALVASASEAE